MKLFLLLTISLFIYFLINPAKITAADLGITCDNWSCTPENVSSIFPADYWYPGKSVTKTIMVSNNNTSPKTVGIKANNISTVGNLDQLMTIDIGQTDSSSQLWSGSLSQFYKSGEIKLADIPGGENKEFYFKVTLPESIDDQLQNQSTSYNLIIGLINTDALPTPTPTTTSPTPANATESNPNSTSSTSTTDLPTPTLARATELSLASEVTPTGEILGQQNETPPVMTSGTSCKNPWWGFLLLPFQGLFLIQLLKHVRRNTLFQATVASLAITSATISVFWIFFCLRFLVLIPMIINILTLYFIYKKLKFASQFG